MKRLCVFCLVLGMPALILLFASAPASSAHAATFKQETAKAGAYASDAALTAEIKAKFLVEKDLDSMDLKVETVKGVVTLRGQVLKESQAGLAEKIARATKGVRDVKNKISVMP